jgi:hypothetical protein
MAKQHVSGSAGWEAGSAWLMDSARKVISKYELYHKGLQGKATGLKA